MKNLIIDDNAETKIYERKLEYDIDIAPTVESGIELLSKNKYEILYLDLYLGCGRSGYEILNWLSDNLDRVPNKIISVSYIPDSKFLNMIEALLLTAKRGVK